MGEGIAVGETACEKLGALHLLSHGILAFKAYAPGERTDLILGDRLVIDDDLIAGTEGIVLTEWKRVKVGDKRLINNERQKHKRSDIQQVGWQASSFVPNDTLSLLEIKSLRVSLMNERGPFCTRRFHCF